MKKARRKTPIRLLSLLLAAFLLIGIVPVAAFANEAPESKKCTVIAHGGIIENEKSTTPFDGTAKSGAKVIITLDDSAFEGHDFVCWKGDDGTEIPQKSFRLLVERNCAFYPVFSDLVGNFGEWRELIRGEFCEDGVIYVREDNATGLKEYKFERSNHKGSNVYKPLDSIYDMEMCSVCGKWLENYHSFDNGVITTAPTHTTEGVKTYTCKKCEYHKTESVPATDPDYHSYDKWKIIEKSKNGNPGRRKGICACGETKESYYIEADWEKYYKNRNLEMQTIDKFAGKIQKEWHYNFTDKDGNDVYIYMLARENTTGDDMANYGFKFVDDHTDSLKPVYVMKSQAYYGYFNKYKGYDWSQFEYARNADEYISKIDSMVIYGGGRTAKYSSRAFDAFKAWETFYNSGAKENPEWYIDAGYTRTECNYLGYDCWEYKKAGSSADYDTVYRVVKSDNTCLYYIDGGSRSGYKIEAIKDMYYEDSLPDFSEEDTLAEFNWRKTHCVVKEIGTDTEQSNKTKMSFSTAPVQAEKTAGFRFYVNHYPMPIKSTATYYFRGGGEDDQSFNFDIIPRFVSLRDYDRSDDDAVLVRLEPRTDSNYEFDHWEKYDWETSSWSKYEGPLEFNYVVSKRNENGDKIYDDNGYVIYDEDHRLTDIMYFRGMYNLKTRHIKVEGGSFIFNGKKVSEADVPHGTVISLFYDNREGYSFNGFIDSDNNRLYFDKFSSLTVEKDMTYTADYEKQIVSNMSYVEATADNGRVLLNGKEFYSGEFESGTELTLTTEANEDYPYYFLGWYLSDGKSGNGQLISKETTLNYTINDYTSLKARWSKTETVKKHNIDVKNGFLRCGFDKLAVSALSVDDDIEVFAIKDPNNPLKIKRWVLSGKFDDESEYTETRDYSEYSSFYLDKYANDGKGYPWNITITGEAEICAEHDWDEGVVTKEPTYTDYGEKTLTCKVCGMQKKEPISMLARYCVHACGECGKCTLDSSDISCTFERCSCGGSALPTQDTAINFIHNNGSEEITPHVYTVVEQQPENPYVNYVLKSAEGYEVEKIYDISFTDASGNKFTPKAGESVTVTLKVGTANAQALRDGRMFIVHISDSGNEIYGLGNKPLTVDVDKETVTFTVDSFSPFVLARTAVSYYGRSALSSLPNSTALLYAYDKITEGIGSLADRITVYDGTHTISSAEIETVLDAYRRDHTEHFWLGNDFSIGFLGDTLTEIIPTYIMSGTALESAKARFDEAVSQLLDGITGSMSEYDREKTLHDRLAEKVTYEESANAHNAYGAIVEGKAVCEGYAEAYQYLLQRAGLQSFIALGKSVNPSTNSQENHAWNIVKVDGKYYHVDLTWDDQGEHLFYAYFNKNDTVITKDHSITKTTYSLPVCNSVDKDFFNLNGGNLESFNAETVGTMLKNGGGTARVYVTGEKNAFLNDLISSIEKVAGYAGVSGSYSFEYATIGSEFILRFKTLDSSFKISGKATSFGSDGEKVKIELIKSGNTSADYSTEITGNSTDYSIPAVESGTYTLRVSKKNHAAREYTLTVGTSDVTLDVKIHLLGDINGDGKVTFTDVNKAKLHYKNKSILSGYEFICSDVNGDGKITFADVNKIKLHYKNKSLLW